MTTIVQVRTGGKRTRGETLEKRRERVEREAQQGQTKQEAWDALEALFAKPAGERAQHRA